MKIVQKGKKPEDRLVGNSFQCLSCNEVIQLELSDIDNVSVSIIPHRNMSESYIITTCSTCQNKQRFNIVFKEE